MATSDARPVPKKNVAFRVIFPILDADGDLVTAATGLDSEVSKDQGTFVDCANEAIEIATASGMYYLDLTATEMNADCVTIIVKTSTSGAKTTPIVMYPEEAGDIRTDTTMISGDAVAADNLEALLDGTGGVTLVASAFTLTTPITANATQISGDTVAADNAELFFDNTGFNASNSTIGTTTTVTNVVSANVTQWLGTAVATPTVAGVPEVDLTHVNGSTTVPTNLVTVYATDFAANYNTSLDQWNVNTESWDGFAVPAATVPGVPEVDLTHITGATTVDTVPIASMFEALMAVLMGQATVAGSTISFKKRDGTTGKVSVTVGGTAGQRTASTIT